MAIIVKKSGRGRNQVVTLDLPDPATGATVFIGVLASTMHIEVHTQHPNRFSKPVLETHGNDGLLSVELGESLPRVVKVITARPRTVTG